jgi:hypothetical protein
MERTIDKSVFDSSTTIITRTVIRRTKCTPQMYDRICLLYENFV